MATPSFVSLCVTFVPLWLMPSRQYPGDQLPVHVGQPHVPAAEPEGQPLVVDAEQVQHGRVQVVDLYPVADHLVAPLVGLAVHGAALDPAAGQPEGERELVVVAAVGP